MSEDQLIRTDYKMVWHCIHKYGFDATEDNFQTGCIGLIKAFRKFDASKGYSFTTFAYRCIFNEIGCAHRKPIVTHVYLDDKTWRIMHDDFPSYMDNDYEVKNALKYVLGSFYLNEVQQQLFYDFYIRKSNGYHMNCQTLADDCNLPITRIYALMKKIKLAFLEIYEIA